MMSKNRNLNQILNSTKQQIISKLFVYFVGLIVILFSTQILLAQGAEIENNIYKNTKTKKETTKPKTTKQVVKPAPPKATPPKKVVNKPVAKKSPVKKTTKKTNNSILVTFNTPEPNQVIWRGNEKIGTTNEEAKLETWMSKGNYLVSVKNQDGEIVLNSMLISISAENKSFKLEKPIVEEEIPQPTAEESLEEQQLKVTLDDAEKVNDILLRYGDPLKTSTVTLADWEFVYQMAQANQIKDFTAIQIEAQRWFSSGQIDFAKGNYANAYAAFVKSAEFMPDSAYPFYALGEAYWANKQAADALIAYQKAVQINPKFALAHKKIGDIHLVSNRTKEASASYQTAVKNGFDTPDVRFALGKSYLKNREWDNASKELEFVVKEAPTGDVYVTLGDLYLELKRNISAYEAYKKATELAPNSAQAFYKLGEILFNEREYELSKVAFESAVGLDEKGTQININQAKKLLREAAQKIK